MHLTLLGGVDSRANVAFGFLIGRRGRVLIPQMGETGACFTNRGLLKLSTPLIQNQKYVIALEILGLPNVLPGGMPMSLVALGALRCLNPKPSSKRSP